ncbi:MAG TPA: choice-of-anchor L domain-containing protein [Bacteroidia bacterium]|nr:choice-of-anchor L domain-containing protein [Bacteroidia bacterium]
MKRFTSQFIRFTNCKGRSFKAVPVLVAFLFFTKASFSQLQTDATANLTTLVQNIIGPGYNVSNIKLNCAQGAYATFTSGGTLGINSGILLSTGQASTAKPPNNNRRTSFTNGTPGDTQLDVILAGTETYDGCALEFDLIPSCDTLKIKYVFATEEYPDYVNGTFNDIFCFFVSGPGINGTKNIATVPGTNTPVTINSINNTTNSQYFVDNMNNSKGTQFNGFTKPLMAFTPVTACSTYHLKIVIADVTDPAYDSGVFIEAGSITCSPVIYNNLATNVNGVRGCQNGNFTFCRTGDRTNPYVVNYTIGGTAVNGVDYQTLPGSVTIPAGQECATVEVVPMPSGSPKPLKTIEITYKYGFCPEPNTIVLTLTDPIPLDAGPDKVFCSGDSTVFGPRGTGTSTTFQWTPATGLNNPNIARPTVTLTNNTNADITYKYVLKATVTATKCEAFDTVAITVKPHPMAKFYDISTSHCLNSITSFRDTSTAIAGTSIVDWYWEFGNNLFDTVRHSSTTYTQAGIYNVRLVVTDNNGCVDDTIMPIEVFPLPEADFKAVSACLGDSVSFVNTTTVSGTGTVSQCLWHFGDGGTFIVANNPKHLYDPTSGIKTYNVQLIATSNRGCIGTVMKPIEIYPKPTVDFKVNNVCLFAELKFNNYSDGNLSFWSFGDGTTSSNRNPTKVYATSGVKTVKLQVTNNFGCVDSLTKPLTVFPQPKFNFSAKDTAGCPVFITQFDAIKDPLSDSIVSWKWIFNPASIKYGPHVESAPYRDAGRFSPSLVATSINGCMDTLTKQYYIHVYPEPIASFYLSPNELSIYEMKTQVIDNSSSDVNTWNWNLGDGTTEKNKTKFYHDYSGGNESFYTVTLDVKNKYGCTGSTSRVVRVRSERAVYIPNAFTPNGDGINDKFMPYASGDYLNANFEMRIFDRWGNKLLFSSDLNQGWNGFYKGQLCERDVYVYTIVFTNKDDGGVMARFKGIVTLVQ